MPSLLGGYFDAIPDPRRKHGKRHALADIFALTLCAVVSGANDFVAIEAFGRAQEPWLRQRFALAGGIPSHDTLARIFALLERDHVERSFAEWAAAAFERIRQHEAEPLEAEPPLVAIDGKRLRRARAAGTPMLSVVSAWATESALALGQVTTTKGEGEIAAIPRLLALLDLSGCIVTMDAAGCQTDLAEQIVAGGADYVLVVKGNQSGLRTDIRHWLAEAVGGGRADVFETAERGHGREETRRYCCAAVPADTMRALLWPGLRSVGVVESSRTVGGKRTVEQRYFATSLRADAEALGRAVRGHWGVENGLHWVLDVAFREDESRSRIGHAAANLSVVRRLATTLLQAEPFGKGGVQTRRMRAAWDAGYRERVLQLE